MQDPPKFSQIGTFGLENMPSGNPVTVAAGRQKIMRLQLCADQYWLLGLMGLQANMLIWHWAADFRRYLPVNPPGTDVMILKIFRQKNRRKHWRF
jgi:hypothetical protein